MITDAGHNRLQDETAALEVLVAEHTRELAETVKELEAFAYSVAHDLRAPLRAIHGFSRALLEDYPERFEGGSLDYIHRICRASERMSELIDDLLKLSRIGRGDIERNPIDLSALVTEIGKILAEREAGRQVRLEVEPDVTVWGDARLLTIAFENLVGNAWKFTRRRDVAMIRLFTSTRDGRRVVCLSDNGTGFDTRYRDKLFTPFQRLHRAEDFEGTGIGLVTVARVLARHGGQVTIDSVEGEGTTVSVYIPAVDGRHA